MNVVWNASKTVEAIERRKRGETLQQIADALGTSTTPVFHALRKAGIPAPPKNYIRWSPDMDETLITMREQKVPQRKIAEAIGVDISAMLRRCKEIGI